MRAFCIAVGGAVLVALGATSAIALEELKPQPSEKYLGAAITGPNYKVRPLARTDGIMRIFDVETPFGTFQFNGVDFTKMRLRELQAVAALDKMSQSDRFTRALGSAVVAPLQFGVSLITNPVQAIGRSFSGVANMFDRTGAELANNRSSRDTFFDSLLGVSDTQRQLAVELDVDPYSDFPPLAERLNKIAGAMASGGMPVKAGLAFIPGGIGLAVSSASTIEDAKDTLRDKTASQVIAEVRHILFSLKVSNPTIDRLLENRNYTPADLLIMAGALARIQAQNTEIYVADAALAVARDEAFYQRRRAELLASRREQLGGIETFFSAKGRALTLTPGGVVVAAFPFDDFAWGEITARGFGAATADLKQGDTANAPLVFATPGNVTPVAAKEMTKLGWKIVALKRVR